MNELDNNKIDHLIKDMNPNAKKISLADLSAEDAITLLNTAFQNGAKHDAFIVTIPPAIAGQGQTVFQPVGKFLLNNKKNGTLSSCIPLTSDIGFYIELP